MRRTWLWTGVLLAVIAGGSYALYLYLQPQQLPEQLLYGNGHIEGTEVRVAAEVGGRVTDSRLVEGKTVGRGDLLIMLDDTDLELQRSRAEAVIETLQRQRERAVRELEVALHHLRMSESDLARYRELRARGTISQQRLEEAENAFEGARGRAAALEAEIRALEGQTTAADRDLDLIVRQIGKTRITAPIDGTVLVKSAEAGELVRSGQTVAILVDLRRVDLRVFIPESELGKARLGAPARVRVSAFPQQQFEARVARVDQRAQFTPRDIHMPEERVRMVFGVTLALDNPEGVLKPGMPADVWILWRLDADWPDHLFVPG
jgi:HlyD family secretion protein